MDRYAVFARVPRQGVPAHLPADDGHLGGGATGGLLLAPGAGQVLRLARHPMGRGVRFPGPDEDRSVF